MSIHCLSHVMRYSEAQLGARLVLFVLAEHAHDDGSDAYPSVNTIADRCRLSRRSVQAALRKLESDGMIIRDGLGPAQQTKWRVVIGGADSSPLQDLRGEADDTRGRGSRPAGGEAASPDPSFNPEKEPLESSSSGEWIGVPAEMRLDAEELLRRKQRVNGQLVTAREMQIAAAALAEFNRQAEADYGLGAQIVRIVGRIRERANCDAAGHIRLVRSAWRLRWWERAGRGGRVTPQVIYGSAGCFEQVWQDAVAEAAGRQPEPLCTGAGVLKSKVYGDGRSWDELTRAEQENAKEAVAMGLEPWRAGPGDTLPSRVAVTNGLTSENFLDDDLSG